MKTATKRNYPAWVTEKQRELWDAKFDVKVIDVKSLVKPGKFFEALICRPSEMAVMMSSEKMSSLTGGNNLAASNAIIGEMCSLKHPDLQAECELGQGEYAIDHNIQIGRTIKATYPSSEVSVKKSLDEV